MKRIALVLIALIAISAHADDDSAIQSAKQVVMAGLKDPDSAQFKNVAIVNSGKRRAICGEVNAKNGYGGYMGFKSFYSFEDSTTYVMKSGDRMMDQLVDMVCKPK